MLDGTPLDWNLQEAVARIPDEDWEKGAAHVAGLVARIERRFVLAEMAGSVADYLRSPVVPNAPARNPMIGHNKPPRDEELPLDPSDIDGLVANLLSIKSELRAPAPNVEEIKAATAEVEIAERKVRRWLAGKLDVAADEFFKEFGKWGGRAVVGGLTAAGLWFLGLFQNLSSLVQALREFIAALAG